MKLEKLNKESIVLGDDIDNAVYYGSKDYLIFSDIPDKEYVTLDELKTLLEYELSEEDERLILIYN